MPLDKLESMEEPHPDVPSATHVREATIEAAVAGDRDALQSIYHSCAEPVYRLMARMVGEQDAEDLSQQVFLRAFAKLAQFSGQANFTTWLYRVAINEALQHRRSGKLRQTQSLVHDPAHQPVDHLEQAERAAAVRAAVAAMDLQLRAILMLKEEQNLSYQQIAEVVGIPAGTVGSRLSRARTQLRELLRDLS